MNKFVLAILASGILIFYFVSLLNFIFDIDKKYIIKNNINNIVVLTGNTGRLVFGLNLMSNNAKSRMLITGVAKGVKYSEIIKNKHLKKNSIELGYTAHSTFGNAIETNLWIKRQKVNDIILVTDSWHMQRALLLFNAAMPNVNISPYPIQTINFKIKDYFKFDSRVFFIYQEHLKYIVSHIQVIYLWLIN